MTGLACPMDLARSEEVTISVPPYPKYDNFVVDWALGSGPSPEDGATGSGKEDDGRGTERQFLVGAEPTPG